MQNSGPACAIALPLIIGAIPFGIIFGTLSGGAGLSAAGAMGMSVFVFAGSSQFIAMGLVGAGTAWPMIVLTTFVVNFRHLLYTATLLPYLQRLPSHCAGYAGVWPDGRDIRRASGALAESGRIAPTSIGISSGP